MILCCGEALIDMLPTSGGGDHPAWAAHAGGSVFNTAVALGRLGAPAGLLTGLSTDLFGDILRADLDAAKVSYDLTDVSDRKTALAFVILTDGQARYSFHDVGSAHRECVYQPALPDRVKALFFGGISLASEPCGSALEDLLHSEHDRRLIFLDPNIRPAYIEEADAYRARLARMIGLANIVKLSDEDLAWLQGDQGSVDDQIDRLLEAGPSVVLVTQGARGALVCTKSGLRFDVPAKQVPIVDTVGAGDTFNAGFLAKLNELGLADPVAFNRCTEDNLREAASYAAAAAAVVVTRAGANAPWREEMIQ